MLWEKPKAPPTPTRDTTIIWGALLWPQGVRLTFLKARKHGGRPCERSVGRSRPRSLARSLRHSPWSAARRRCPPRSSGRRGSRRPSAPGAGSWRRPSPAADAAASSCPCSATSLRLPLGAAAAEERRCQAPEAADARWGPAAHPEPGGRGLRGAGLGASERAQRRAALHLSRMPRWSTATAHRSDPDAAPLGSHCPHATPEPGQPDTQPERHRGTRCSRPTGPSRPRSRRPRQLPPLATRLQPLRQTIARPSSEIPSAHEYAQQQRLF